MRGKCKKFMLVGSSTVTFALSGILLPGCETFLSDPQAFFTEEPCNIVNCDTFFFLQENHAEEELEVNFVVDDHDDIGI